MYLKIKNKKIEIVELNSFKERFKGLKFVLEPIDYGVKFPHKKWISTNFLCQKIDVVFTDEEDKIIDMLENVKSEKYLGKWKCRNIYFLPLNTIKDLKLGEKMPLKDEKN